MEQKEKEQLISQLGQAMIAETTGKLQEELAYRMARKVIHHLDFNQVDVEQLQMDRLAREVLKQLNY